MKCENCGGVFTPEPEIAEVNDGDGFITVDVKCPHCESVTTAILEYADFD